MSDLGVAKLCRNLNINIAVDLKGFTQDSRAGIFAHRAAPIQVNYLGYPGTMGADYMDYIVADKTLIPVEFQISTIRRRLHIYLIPIKLMIESDKFLVEDLLDRS
jgi:predicted O-linked N-acetylglucosamine transferase (SPINDLY family)